jgi:hypothetical protein
VVPLGVAAAVRRQGRHALGHADRAAADLERAVELQVRRRGRGGAQLAPGALAEERRQRVDPIGGHGQACCHRMAAALAQDPGIARGNHGGAEIEARDRAARALADAILEADHDCGAVVALDQPRGGII